MTENKKDAPVFKVTLVNCLGIENTIPIVLADVDGNDDEAVKENMHQMVRDCFVPGTTITKIVRIRITEDTIFDLPVDRN